METYKGILYGEPDIRTGDAKVSTDVKDLGKGVVLDKEPKIDENKSNETVVFDTEGNIIGLAGLA